MIRLLFYKRAKHDDGLAVSVRPSDGCPIEPLGFVQDKHAPWLAPLLAVGATVCLSAVTGRRPGRTMGVNILFGFVGLAIQARRSQAGPDPSPSDDDVILHRCRQGAAEVRFAPSGQPVRDPYEWGYGGKGPSRLALNVLRQFAGEDDAQRLSRDFLLEVVARVPRARGRIESRFVRAWIATRSTH